MATPNVRDKNMLLVEQKILLLFDILDSRLFVIKNKYHPLSYLLVISTVSFFLMVKISDNIRKCKKIYARKKYLVIQIFN